MSTLAKLRAVRDAAFHACVDAPLNDVPEHAQSGSEQLQALIRYAPPYPLYEAFRVAEEAYQAACRERGVEPRIVRDPLRLGLNRKSLTVGQQFYGACPLCGKVVRCEPGLDWVLDGIALPTRYEAHDCEAPEDWLKDRPLAG